MTGFTAENLVASTGEFAFLKAKLDAGDSERRRLEEELTRTRLEQIRKVEAGRREGEPPRHLHA